MSCASLAPAVCRGRDVLVPLLVAYGLAYGLMLLNPGRFWDGWWLYTTSGPTRYEIYAEPGHAWTWWLQLPLWWLGPHPLQARAAIALVYLAIALAIDASLKRLPGVPPGMRAGIVVVAAVLPLNGSRIALSHLMHGLPHLAFWLACAAFVRHLTGGDWRWRPLAAVGFFLSFHSPSHLPLLVLPGAALLWLRWVPGPWWRQWRLALQVPEFFLVPVAFLVWRATFGAPDPALYADYNPIKPGALLPGLALSLWYLPSLLGQLLGRLGQAVADAPVFFLLYWGLATWFLARRQVWSQALVTGSPARAGVVLVIGAAASLVALWPYVTVGKVPHFTNWDSRHQLPLAFGAAVCLWAGIALVARWLAWSPRAAVTALAGVVAASVLAVQVDQVAFHRDWVKQAAFMRALALRAEHPALAGPATLFVEDQTRSLNANDRHYTHYEWSQLASAALGRDDHLIVPQWYFEHPSFQQRLPVYRAKERFALAGWQPEAPRWTLRLRPGPLAEHLDAARLATIVRYLLTRPAKADGQLALVLELDLIPVAQEAP